ncbi:MAG: L,D-transpeptidase family protein [Polyangiaceae bacterium]
MKFRLSAWALGALVGLAACKGGAGAGADAGAEAGADAAPAPAGSQGASSVPAVLPPSTPMLGITAFVATVYSEPRDTSKKLGYLRVGAKVGRKGNEPAGKAGCPGGWWEIFPAGYVCGDQTTTELESPILRAAARGPNLKTPLPYRYGFVRAVLPLYLRIPTAEEQKKSEFKLDEHLDWFKDNTADVSRVILGANDVAIDERGVPRSEKKLGELGLEKNSLETPLGVLLGGDSDVDPPPFWLADGKRAIPNISDFEVGPTSVFADRARRKTGLALIGSFPTGPESLERRFAITTDLRLAPASKVKPDTGSPFHGTELDAELTLPLAFVRAQGARLYKIVKGKVTPSGEAEHRGAYALTGKMRTVEGVKYYRTKDKRWLHQLDVGLAVAPATWPEAANKGEKWIEVSLGNQTLVLWEGKKPVYATLVSTGKAGIADPKTTTATVQGTFRIRNKHVTATMDSNEASVVGGQADTTARGDDEDDEAPTRKASAPAADAPVAKKDDGKGKAAAPKAKTTASKDAAGKGKEKGKDAKGKDAKAKSGDAKAKNGDAKAKSGDARPAEKPKAAAKGAELPHEDYVPRKGDGLYGVTRRRGEGKYVLRDVPYIQYFASGYALHAAYWHDVFGTPRSHGCINLSPVDAHRVFLWTEPAVPEGWHAMNTGPELGEGTVIVVHE